jgi:hypothetical protein
MPRTITNRWDSAARGGRLPPGKASLVHRSDGPICRQVGLYHRRVSPKPKAELAREHLDRARSAIAEADATEAVTWLLAALEAAVVALAQAEGLEVPTHHWKKAQVATQLHEKGLLDQDFAATLDMLNDGRKVAVYEGEEPELGEATFESLFAEVESAVVAAEEASQ